MKNLSNPFKAEFGSVPESYIPRNDLENGIYNSFITSSTGTMQLVTGIRGSGKTVLITRISDRIAKEKKWIVIKVNPEAMLYENVIYGLTQALHSSNLSASLKINLSPLSVSFSKDNYTYSSEEEKLENLLKQAEKRKKKVLICMDEITNNKETRVFLHSFQIYLRDCLPVYILASGLPQNVYSVINSRTLTFLQRAQKCNLSPLKLSTVMMEYSKVFSFPDETVMKMARLTKGYSYAFQLLGDLVWKNNMEYTEDLLNEYDSALAEYSYDKIYSEMSNKDIFFMEVITKNHVSTVRELVNELGITLQEFSVYRDRLIKSGILYAPKRGYFEIALPRFGEYLTRKQDLQMVDDAFMIG